MDEDVIDQSGEPEVELTEQAETDQVQTDDATEDQTESDSQETETEDDSEEIEFEGEKYKVPKHLKDAFLRQSDYTRKTQEVSEQRKELEQAREEFQQRAEVQQRHIQDYAELHALDVELKRYQQVDWDALINQDPVEAMKLDRQYRTLSETRSGIVQRIQEVEAKQQFQRQQEYAKALESGSEVLKREIPGWSREKASELKEFAVTQLGIDKRQIDSLLDPKAVIALHYAKIGYQTLKQAAQKPKATEAKPVQKVSAKRETSTVNPDKLSADDWMKWREKQLRKQR